MTVFSKTSKFHYKGYLGIIYPDTDIRENYPGKVVFGAGVLYDFNRVNATLDYLFFNSEDKTPYTKTPAKLSIHNLFFGAELPLFKEKKACFIGGGASLNFLSENVGVLGNFKSSKTGFYASAGTNFSMRSINIGIKMIYNFLKIQDIRSGGFFLLLSAGF